MNDSLLGEDPPTNQLASRASSAPKDGGALKPALSRVELTSKITNLQKVRATRLAINKFSFCKKEADELEQQSSKPLERSLAESQSVTSPKTPVTPNHVSFGVTFAVPSVKVTPTSDQADISDQIHEQLSSFREVEALDKVKKFKYGYDKPSFCKEILRKLFTDIKQPQCFAAIMKLFQKYGRSSVRISHRALEMFDRVAQLSLPFDLRKLFPFEYLFTELDPQNAEKATFRMIKPRLIEVLDRDNIYIVAKMCSFALGTGRDIEEKIYCYYVRKLAANYLKCRTREQLNATIAALLLYQERITDPIKFFYKLFKTIDKNSASESTPDLLRELTKQLSQSTKKWAPSASRKEYYDKLKELRLFSDHPDDPELERLLKILDTI